MFGDSSISLAQQWLEVIYQLQIPSRQTVRKSWYFTPGQFIVNPEAEFFGHFG